MGLTRRNFLLAAAASATAVKFANVTAGETAELDPDAANIDKTAWNEIRAHLFGDRPIKDAAGVVQLEAPEWPGDSGRVPMRIAGLAPQTKGRHIVRHHLVIDQNPSPVAGAFEMSPGNGRADIETNMRVNAFSHVRVISETNDGQLHMHTRFVKAAGGCSGDPLRDEALTQLTMGNMKLEQTAPVKPGEIGEFHLKVKHPNHSGFQKHPMTGYFIPAHFVSQVTVKDDLGNTAMKITGDISFSQDPDFKFAWSPRRGSKELIAHIVDSRQREYEARWPIAVQA